MPRSGIKFVAWTKGGAKMGAAGVVTNKLRRVITEIPLSLPKAASSCRRAGDPVKDGLVASLNRPGGNATGSYVATPEMEQKRLSLLHELVPGVPLIGALVNPNSPDAARQLPELEEAARIIGRRLVVAKASNDDELNAAFALLLRQGIGALLVAADPYFDTRRDRIIAFAAQNRLPAVYHFREYAFAGGLVSYAPSITDAYRQAGNYTGRVLKGEKPA